MKCEWNHCTRTAVTFHRSRDPSPYPWTYCRCKQHSYYTLDKTLFLSMTEEQMIKYLVENLLWAQ